MAERESNRRKENTARQGVPVEDMKPFARFLLPKIQVFYETEEGQRAFQEWNKHLLKHYTAYSKHKNGRERDFPVVLYEF